MGAAQPHGHGVTTSGSTYVLRDAGGQEASIFVYAGQKQAVAHIVNVDSVEAIYADTIAVLLGEKLEAFTALGRGRQPGGRD